MNTRDEFAKAAMQVLLAQSLVISDNGSSFLKLPAQEIASWSYTMADAMCAEKRRREEADLAAWTDEREKPLT